MSSYDAYARSNYFQLAEGVRYDDFKKLEEQTMSNGDDFEIFQHSDGRVAFEGMPSGLKDENGNEQFDTMDQFVDTLRSYINKHDVIVVQEVGYETRSSYVTSLHGQVLVITATQWAIRDFNDIQNQLITEMGIDPDDVPKPEN